MTYKVFETQAQAQEYADFESAKLPKTEGCVTTAWDIPRQTKTGQWIVASADGHGVEYDPDWFEKDEEL